MKRRRRSRHPDGIPPDDSWGLLLRDALPWLAGWSLVGLGLLWLAELPAARRVPAVAALPRLSDQPGFAWLPRATKVFGIPELPAPKPSPVSRPMVRHKPREVPATPLPSPTPPARIKPRQPAAVMGPVSPPPVPGLPARTSRHGVRHTSRAVNSVPVQVVTVDLMDPSVVATVRLAHNAPRPNVAGASSGAEAFEGLVKPLHAAAVINGTFFSKDAEQRVMGNMVRDGALVKFSQWERGGTTFALGAGNRPRMTTDGVDGDPEVWNTAWLALTAGPRLLRDGVTWCRPAEEGFKDPHVLGTAARSAIGFDAAGRKLFLVSFDAGVTLPRAAEVMRAVGCTEAMNLDGGDSRALAVGGRVIVKPGRPLTNVLAIYDRHHPAPKALRAGFWEHGQD